ncbi:hypothetical protein BJ684DRAFT_19485 [Piptocephalis cylindrospora]|uniref:Uncharacterized protein n=1 Tax=Piptocephalis cylindrospora TaxID=1907219 RepID=A0A4P9Y541_9FUNG|nr:hypothetical protein BJ684DRAFT_19485 [Piptocephalis cylindrospora]|eukprot:RKP14087.1 hypothetical protein BJ684DRAFT_19485 [Piptocephalis cylindrospora]
MGAKAPATVRALRNLQQTGSSSGGLKDPSTPVNGQTQGLDLNSWIAVGQVVSPLTLTQTQNFDSASLQLYVGGTFPSKDGNHHREWLKVRVLIKGPTETTRAIETIRLGSFIMVKGTLRYSQPYDTFYSTSFTAYVEADQIVPLFSSSLVDYNGRMMGRDVVGSAQSMTLIGRVLHPPRLIHSPDPMYLSTVLTETTCGSEEHQILQLAGGEFGPSMRRPPPPFRPGDRVHAVGRATVKTLEDEDGYQRYIVRIVAQSVKIIIRAKDP